MAINEVLAALADDTRRKILLNLQEGKIIKAKKADLIYETRYKNFIYYELNLSILDETIMWISKLRGGQQ